jgi:hypothetical protein
LTDADEAVTRRAEGAKHQYVVMVEDIGRRLRELYSDEPTTASDFDLGRAALEMMADELSSDSGEEARMRWRAAFEKAKKAQA